MARARSARHRRARHRRRRGLGLSVRDADGSGCGVRRDRRLAAVHARRERGPDRRRIRVGRVRRGREPGRGTGRPCRPRGRVRDVVGLDGDAQGDVVGSTLLEPGRRVLLANAVRGRTRALADADVFGRVRGDRRGHRAAGRRRRGHRFGRLGRRDERVRRGHGRGGAARRRRASSERRAAPRGNGWDTNDNAADWFVQAVPSPQGLAAPPVPGTAPTPTPDADTDPDPDPAPTPTADPDADAHAPTPTPTPTPTARRRRRPRRRPRRPRRRRPRTDADAHADPARGCRRRHGSRRRDRLDGGRPGHRHGRGRTDRDERVFTVADATGGIAVRIPTGVAAPARGTQVEVTGKLAAPYGQLEIRPDASGTVAVGSGCCPSRSSSVGGRPDEATESRLIVVTGIVPKKPTKGSGGDLTLSLERAGAPALKVLADLSSGVPSTAFEAGGTYRLTGIVGQRATHTGALDGYRLWIRDVADVVRIAGPAATPSPTPRSTPTPHGSPTPKPSTTPSPRPAASSRYRSSRSHREDPHGPDRSRSSRS